MLVVDKASVTPAPGSLTATFLMHVTFVSSWDCIFPLPPAWPGAGGACWSYHYLLARASLAIPGLAICHLKKRELSFFTLPQEPLEETLLITKIQSLLSPGVCPRALVYSQNILLPFSLLTVIFSRVLVH